jgi:hypothetical protein
MLVGLVEQVSVDLGASPYMATDRSGRFTPETVNRDVAFAIRPQSVVARLS